MRKLTGETIVAEITLIEPVDSGYIASTPDGKNCFVAAKVVAQNAMKAGDKLTGALVPHKFSRDCGWFAEWVVPSRLVTIEEVNQALALLQEGGAMMACDLGIHAADILFHAGLAQKIVGFDRRQDVDASKHIAYTIELESVLDWLAYEDED